jgi:glucose 1-dehydrogenase
MKAVIVRFRGVRLMASDITDALSLSRKLIKGADPVSRFLVGRLSRKPLQKLARANDAGLKLSLAALVEELNAIIEGPSIFEERRFAEVSLSEEAHMLVAQRPKKAAKKRLNRMLLEEAYAREIRNHRNPVPDSVGIEDVPMPKMDKGRYSRQVLVKVLRVGIDATDKEINEGKYGRAPEGENYLILGHEVFGIVIQVGGGVTHVKPGDYVTCTVRRNGGSIYDHLGNNDMTADAKYYERGIAYLPGFLTEYFVDEADFIVKVPVSIKHLGVLAEPASVVAKGIEQAYKTAQTRLRVWKPRLAFVLGAGQIGLLAALMLRLRGVEVYTLARTRPPCLKAEIATALGAHYVSTRDESMRDLATRVGRPDLIFEATGSSEIAFRAMEVLKINGVLVWSSITGESSTEEQCLSVPGNRINLEFVLGNKTLIGTVNGNAEHFRVGIQNLIVGNEMFPGVLERILSHPIQGLDMANPMEMFRSLGGKNPALKVYVIVNHE